MISLLQKATHLLKINKICRKNKKNTKKMILTGGRIYFSGDNGQRNKGFCPLMTVYLI